LARCSVFFLPAAAVPVVPAAGLVVEVSAAAAGEAVVSVVAGAVSGAVVRRAAGDEKQ
jgi:hypothetical protein